MKDKKNKVKSPQKEKNKARKIIFGILVAIVIAILFSISAIFIIIYYSPVKVDVNKMINDHSNLSIIDNNGNVINQSEKENEIAISELNEYTVNAFIAIEDKRFYKHNGLDFYRIAGSGIKNIKSGKISQGGSTITQQLIKNTHLDSKKTFKRKLLEAQLAVKLEKMYSKQEIMQMYLNMLYFGSGEYGVANASMRFFGKKASELTIMESCVLAAIPKSPTKYNPINNYDNSIQRAKIVANLMLEQKLISQNDYNNAQKEKIVISNTNISKDKNNSYIKNTISQAVDILGIPTQDLLYGNYTIKTFYDDFISKTLTKSFESSEYDQIGIYVDNTTRGINAIHTSSNFDLFTFRRQPGSTIKPLISYAPALESGNYQPISFINDIPTDFNGYCPSNYKDNYLGSITLMQALSLSQNIPAVKLYEQLGSEYCRQFLIDMGFKFDEKDNNLALSLGGMTYGTTFLELCNGYTTLANNGKFVDCSFIKEITDKNGKVIYSHSDKQQKQVYSPQTAYLTTTMLEDCVKSGTAKKLNAFDFSIASKTGTVSNSDKNYNNDIYNISYTTANTLLIWQGSVDKSPMPSNFTGGGVATWTAKTFYNELQSFAPKDFDIPQGIVKVKLDSYAYHNNQQLVLASPSSPNYASFDAILSEQSIMKLPQDNSYDNLNLNDLEIIENEQEIIVKFSCNPRISYEILAKEFMHEEIVIQNISNNSQTFCITLPKSLGLFDTNYTIIPYYLDDNSNKIIGLPRKITTFDNNFNFPWFD